MSNMFADIKEVCVYINGLLLIANELEYLGYLVTRKGIKPLQKKIEAILKIAPPTTREQIHSFIDMINYYCDMWQGHIKVLVPFAMLTSKTTPWKLMSVEQKAFKQTMSIASQEILLVYPDFNILFEVHMVTSDT
eukprot:9586084-Ditylum_brightwellii.AAC.1